ncbi:hypothetical protein GC176_02435 [bacterium]|nr:hypothetical protein [bacterium]
MKPIRVTENSGRDEEILDIVEQLIGTDIVLWGCQAFCKPPGDWMEVPWHQDGNYWPIRPLATCTLWIPQVSSPRRHSGQSGTRRIHADWSGSRGMIQAFDSYTAAGREN